MPTRPAVAERDRGTVAHPHAVSIPVADEEATAVAVAQPVADTNAGAFRGTVPDIAVTTGRAGPATSFRALRKAMEQDRQPDRSTRRKEPNGPTRSREPIAPVHAPDHVSPKGGFHLNLMKKAISAATSAALLASLLATAVAPSAFAAITIGSAGNVPVGGTSANAATFTFTEQSAAALRRNDRFVHRHDHAKARPAP